jgi:hypothetical protein
VQETAGPCTLVQHIKKYIGTVYCIVLYSRVLAGNSQIVTGNSQIVAGNSHIVAGYSQIVAGYRRI